MNLSSLPGLGHSPAALVSVFKLFLLPVGGGIPAGVLLAQKNGAAWPVTATLYLVSDLVLAVAFEPILRLFAALGRRLPLLARLGAASRALSERSTRKFAGSGAGPIALIMIAFGVDPMTGRTSALAAGHGFLAGWAFAITGDLLYFAVIAVTTVRLNAYFHDPNTAMLIVLAGMFLLPVLLRRLRALGSRPADPQSAATPE